MKKILTLLGINCLIFILIIAGYKVDLNNDAVQDINVEKLNEQIKNNTYYDYNNNDIVDVTIVFTDSSLLDNYYNNTSLLEYINSYEAMYLQEEINKTQNNFINKLESNNVDFLVSNYYDTLFNGISGKLQYKNIEIIEQYTEVEIVLINEVYSVPETQTLDTVDLDSTGIYDTSELEYKGDKMIVAVIDSGFNVAHSVFSNDVDGKYDRNYISSTFNSSYYYSSKLPFIYDYANNNYTVDSTIEHGQHVAGIIAGNDSVITGVAPNAQLALMKVANDNEIILDSCIYSALEDAKKLGVDSINISIGSPGGFSSPQNSYYVNE